MSSNNEKRYDDENRSVSREEAGRRGAEARWGKEEEHRGSRGHNSYSNRSHYNEEDENERGGHSGRSRRDNYHDENEDRPMSREEAGRRGAQARHAISKEKEKEIAERAARTRKEHDPGAFRKMGAEGGKTRHQNEGR